MILDRKFSMVSDHLLNVTSDRQTLYTQSCSPGVWDHSRVHMYLVVYSNLLGWVKCAAHPIFAIQHTFGSHDQYRTVGDQYRTLLESRDEHCTLFKHVKSRDKHSYRTSLCIYWDDTFSGFHQCVGKNTQQMCGSLLAFFHLLKYTADVW